MKKNHITKKYRSLKHKSIIFLSILFFGLYLISSTIFFATYFVQMRENSIESNTKLINQIGYNLDNYIKDWNRMAMASMYDNEVLKILKDQKDNNRMVSAADQEKMNLFLAALYYGKTEVAGITIISENGKVFSERYLNPVIAEKDYIELIKNHSKQGFLAIIPLHEVEYESRDKKNVFSLVKEIRMPYSAEFLGIIKVDVEMDFFEKELLSLGSSKIGLLTIKDDNQNVLYTTKLDGQIDMGNIGFAYQSKQSDLKVIGEVSNLSVLKDISWVIWLYLITVSISLFAIALFTWVGFGKIMNPLIVLKNKMKTIKRDDINTKLEISRNDEIGDLVEGYNLMLDNIKEMMYQIEDITMLQKDAEFYALRSQINPHFINNTLEMINMLAIKNGVYDISDIVSNLGKLMRYTTLKNNLLATIKDETDILIAYANICKLRFEKVHFEYRIDERLKDFTLPRFVLQPIVENAVMHGVEETEGEILIEITKNEDLIRFGVTDNGKGMSSDEVTKLEKIMNMQEKDHMGKTKKGIALRNINQRLIMLYGDQSQLKIQSRPKEGTCFYFHIPLEKE